ncbi:MAG: SRPBCC family protein [Betaproteobacteria bacterium]
MSDHIDGPRQVGDPAGDLSDLFVFTSPANADRTVLALCVFPSAGASAMFSNAVNHSLVVRRATVAGLGDAAMFKTDGAEIRFSVRFDALEPGPSGEKPVQRGTCTLPDGQTLRLLVNDEQGASTPDKAFRVFAGLRSDPFFLAVAGIRPIPNLLQHDNVLGIVVDFDTRRVLDSAIGSLFGAIAETTPLSNYSSVIGAPPPRFDWVGKPEQTNQRLNNGALKGVDDLRDLWNQQTPFAIAEELKPLFRKRLTDSLAEWDMRDGKADWTPAALAASANVFLDDFMLFDVAKPITDLSFLEIERSTLNGRAYQTGGGRTVNANVIDIMVTWMVKRDQGEFMQGGAMGATKPGTKAFPYLASPNAELQSVIQSIDLAASADKVWALIGSFGSLTWHPLVGKVNLTGTGPGQLRAVQTIDGKQMIERLTATNPPTRAYTYTVVSGLPVADYTGTLGVRPKGAGCTVEWRAQYLPDGQADIVIKTILTTLFKVGLGNLKKRFG